MWIILIVCTKLLNMYSFVNKNLPPPRHRRGQEEKENHLALYRDESLKRDIQIQTLKEKHQSWAQKFRNHLVDKRRFMNNVKDKFLFSSDDEDEFENVIGFPIKVPNEIQQKTEGKFEDYLYVKGSNPFRNVLRTLWCLHFNKIFFSSKFY